LKDFLNYEKDNLDYYTFELVVDGNESSMVGLETTKIYVQIKKKEYMMNTVKKTMLSLVDISKSIMYDDVHAQNEFLAITNATVSHELRNPLQSIDAQNIKIKLCLKEL